MRLRTEFLRIPELVVLPRVVDVGGGGGKHVVDWEPVGGMTGVEVQPCSVSIGEAAVGAGDTAVFRDLPVTPMERSGTTALHYEIGLPRRAPVRQLTLAGFGWPAGARNWRIAVSVLGADGTWQAPHTVVPPLGSGAVAPDPTAGGRLVRSRLTLPDISADRLRLSVVVGDQVPTLTPHPFTLGGVDALVVRRPTDLTLTGPDGRPLWKVPGELPAGAFDTVDLTAATRRGLEAALAKGGPGPLTAEFHAVSATPARAVFAPGEVRGFVVRAVPGPVSVTLEGDPAAWTPYGQAVVPPSEARGSVRVRYAGVRVLREASDTRPVPRAGTGLVVTSRSRVLVPPPRSLVGHRIARVGPVGLAVGETQLSVTVTDLAGAPLGPPGVATVAPSRTPGRVWVALDLLAPITGPVRVEVRANVGRFHWFARGGTPSALVAVHDPDPGGRVVRFGSQVLVRLRDDDWRESGVDLRRAFSAGTPTVVSDLFVTVDLADVVLKYSRRTAAPGSGRGAPAPGAAIKTVLEQIR